MAMGATRRKFDHDFREGAVRLVRETGKPIAQVARDLGINAGTLANWVNADGSAFANGSSKLAAYAGLAPITRQSGTSLAGETRSRRDVILAMLRTSQPHRPARPAPALGQAG
jgi:transposase